MEVLCICFKDEYTFLSVTYAGYYSIRNSLPTLTHIVFGSKFYPSRFGVKCENKVCNAYSLVNVKLHYVRGGAAQPQVRIRIFNFEKLVERFADKRMDE